MENIKILSKPWLWANQAPFYIYSSHSEKTAQYKFHDPSLYHFSCCCPTITNILITLSLSLSLSLSLTLTPTNISKKPFPLIPLTCLLSLHLQDVKLYCRVQQGGNQRWSEAPHKAVQTQRRNQGQPGGCSCPPVLNFGWLSRPFERNSSWVG